MSTGIWVALAAALVAGVGVVVLWIKHSAQTVEVLAQTGAALDSEKAHVAALEAAAAEKRRERRLGFDVETAAVKSAADAAELLRRATDPNTN